MTRPSVEHIRAGLLHGAWDDPEWLASVLRRSDLPPDVRALAVRAAALLQESRR